MCKTNSCTFSSVYKTSRDVKRRGRSICTIPRVYLDKPFIMVSQEYVLYLIRERDFKMTESQPMNTLFAFCYVLLQNGAHKF